MFILLKHLIFTINYYNITMFIFINTFTILISRKLYVLITSREEFEQKIKFKKFRIERIKNKKLEILRLKI